MLKINEIFILDWYDRSDMPWIPFTGCLDWDLVNDNLMDSKAVMLCISGYYLSYGSMAL